MCKQFNIENMHIDGRSEELEGREDARLCYGKAGEVPKAYMRQSGNGGLIINQGSLIETEGGPYACNCWDEPELYTKDALISTAELVENEEPLAQIGGRGFFSRMK